MTSITVFNFSNVSGTDLNQRRPTRLQAWAIRVLPVFGILAFGSGPLHGEAASAGDWTEQFGGDEASQKQVHEVTDFSLPLSRPTAPLSAAESISLVPVAVDLRIRDSVEVRGSRIYVKDIAACSGDQNACREVDNIDLGLSPVPGRNLRVTKSFLTSHLQREIPYFRIQIVGPEMVKLTVAVAEIDGAAIEAALLDALAGVYVDSTDTRIHVNKVQVISNTKISPGLYSYAFPELVGESIEELQERLERNSVLNGGNHTMFVVLTPDQEGSAKIRVPVMCQLSLEKLLPVTARDLDRGEILGDHDLKLSWVAVQRGFFRPISERGRLVGFRLKRNLARGQIFDGSMLDRPPVVSRGDILQLKIKQGDLEVVSRVEAQGPGAVGDTISVTIGDSKRTLRARVTGRGTVESVGM